MVTPFLNNVIENDIEKAAFNQRLCRARVVVENTIGNLKAKFPILRQGLAFLDREIWSELVQGDFLFTLQAFFPPSAQNLH